MEGTHEEDRLIGELEGATEGLDGSDDGLDACAIKSGVAERRCRNLEDKRDLNKEVDR